MTSIVSTDDSLEGFNPHAAEAVNWTRKQLSEVGQANGMRDMKMAVGGQLLDGHATLDARSVGDMSSTN